MNKGVSMKFEMYQDKAGKWRWRLVAKNGRTVADSGEGYNSPGNARRAMKAFRHVVISASVVELKPEPKEASDED